MRKYILFLLSILIVSTSSLSAQVSGIAAKAFPRQLLSSQLPVANGSQGMRIVTDALSSSSCTVGGGNVKLICFDNGSWTVVGLGIEGSEGPQGPPGEDGQSATINVGSVTTGVAGSSASIVNSGTELDAIFDFTIPRGDKGETGDQGVQGDTGPAGPVAGSDTQLIFNDSGSAAGDSDLVWDKTANTIQLGGGIKLRNESGDLGIRNSANSDYGAIIGGVIANISGGLYKVKLQNHLILGTGANVIFANMGSLGGVTTGDLTLERTGTSTGKIGDGSSGYGQLSVGKMVTAVQALSITDNGNGSTRATSTIAPTTSYVSLACNDTNGCDITLSETGAVDGQVLRVICTSSNVCGFADTAGISELSSTFDMGQYDLLSLLYATDRWIELSRSNN